MLVRAAVVTIWGVAFAACGRIGFETHLDAMGGDAGPGVSVLVDFSGAHPFDPVDFDDGGSILDNGPSVLCALDPPFTAPLAVIAGRAVLELNPGAATVVHDYTPIVTNTTGPDDPETCLSASTPSTGPALWIGSGSLNGGDGLYFITANWAITREINRNNVGSIILDTTGTITGGMPDLVFSSGVSLYARPSDTEVVRVGMRTLALAHASDGSYAAVITPNDFSYWAVARFVAGSLAHTELMQATIAPHLAVDGAPALPVLGYVILGNRELVAFNADGSYNVIAASADPDSLWVDVISPHAGHPLAGAWYVLESNRVLDRDRVLRITAN